MREPIRTATTRRGPRPASSPPAGVAVQATLAAAIQALGRAARRVRTAEDAALSLAQRERLAAVASDLEGAASELQPRLDPQGLCLMERRAGWAARLRARFQPAEEAPHAPWAEALADAVAALDEAAGRMAARGACASAEAAVLARAVGRRLRAHRDALLHEAGRWSLAA
jgi:hypothetical protein